MEKLLLLILILLSPAIFADEIYKCIDEKGKTLFSQRPCGDTAEKIEVRDATDGIKFDSEGNWDNVKYANKEREVNRKIEKHQETLGRLQAERERLIAELRYQRQFAAKNIAGKRYEKKIDQDIKRIDREYTKKIKAEKTAIENLKKDLETNWK